MIRLALRVPAEHAEIVLAELLELAPTGVEEVQLPAGEQRPAGDGVKTTEKVGAMVEYAVYGAPGELPELPDLQAAVSGVPIEVSTSEVPDDWSERWKQFHRSVLVQGGAGALHVRPPWLPSSGIRDAHEIVIDPAQAFGTGAHATTRLCLELLLEIAGSDTTRPPALDVGSGSGVLAIAAAKLGYAPVLALDYDRESVRASMANAAVNGVEIQARRLDMRREPLLWPRHTGPTEDGHLDPDSPPLVLANLLRPLLLSLAESMQQHRQRPAHLVASGLLCEQADEVSATFTERLSLRERARRERGEWAALWLQSL